MIDLLEKKIEAMHSSFYGCCLQVRPCGEEIGFKNMMMRLRCHCENMAENVCTSDVQVDQFYAGLLQDGYWYR